MMNSFSIMLLMRQKSFLLRIALKQFTFRLIQHISLINLIWLYLKTWRNRKCILHAYPKTIAYIHFRTSFRRIGFVTLMRNCVRQIEFYSQYFHSMNTISIFSARIINKTNFWLTDATISLHFSITNNITTIMPFKIIISGNFCPNENIINLFFLGCDEA